MISIQLPSMTQNTVAASFGTFVQSLAAIGATLATAILNVFYSFLALGQAILSAAGHLGQSVFKRKYRFYPVLNICVLIYL